VLFFLLLLCIFLSFCVPQSSTFFFIPSSLVYWSFDCVLLFSDVTATGFRIACRLWCFLGCDAVWFCTQVPMPRTDLPSPSSGLTNRPKVPPSKCRRNVPLQDRQRCTTRHGATSKKTVCINTPVRTSILVNRTFSHSRSHRVLPTRASWPDKVVPSLLPSA
jgi:hypothetical protein